MNFRFVQLRVVPSNVGQGSDDAEASRYFCKCIGHQRCFTGTTPTKRHEKKESEKIVLFGWVRENDRLKIKSFNEEKQTDGAKQLSLYIVGAVRVK